MSTNGSGSAYTLPDEKTLLAAGDIELLDESGKRVPFKHLYAGSEAGARQLIIFIRHYFCGHCEHYVRALSEHLSQSRLDSLTPPVKLTLIGCGQQSGVADYKKRTNCQFPIYSNPDQKLYKQLGMVINLSMGDKHPDYIKQSLIGNVFSSLITALSSGSQMLKGGDFSQNGGEMLFQNGQLTWIHRMQNTRDHAEIAELEKALGV